jgi:hypothetical protein
MGGYTIPEIVELFYRYNSHSPTGVSGKQPAQFSKRQLWVINPDSRFTIWPSIFNDAPENIASWNPLISSREMSDLWLSSRNLYTGAAPSLMLWRIVCTILLKLTSQ